MKVKERILNFLDSRGCRAIMTMDIPYTDHSYIIGRAGMNIKKILDDILTHIHFPDSNRTEKTEKSNQVSLCGSLESVEKARASVYFSIPLIISYDLPTSILGRLMPDNNTEYVKGAEATHNVQVRFVSRAKLHTSVLVKGCEKEADKVQDATRFLCFHMCGSNQIQVNLQLRIPPQHHDIVKGTSFENHGTNKYKDNISRTVCANIKPIEKSQVNIIGIIDGVYKVRQQLIGNSPVVQIFDYSENSVKQKDINRLMTQFGVTIAAHKYFFVQIIETTGTRIGWSYCMKFGAKTKKDAFQYVCERECDLELVLMLIRNGRITVQLDPMRLITVNQFFHGGILDIMREW